MQIIDCEPPYQLVRGRHGWFLANLEDVYVGRALLHYGEYGEIEWAVIGQMLRPGKDAVEVGANIGSHTVSMARKLAVFGRRLLAVEPQPVIFQNMCANLALNGLFNVLAENAACSEKSGTVSFPTLDYRKTNNFGAVEMREDGAGSQKVRSVPLDDLVPADFDVGMLKIDVEGFEQKVLQGAARTIARCRPLIYLENDRRDRSQALIEHLWSLDYQMWWHLPPLFNPENFAGNAENLYPSVVSVNLMALPTEMPTNIGGLTLVKTSTEHPLARKNA